MSAARRGTAAPWLLALCLAAAAAAQEAGTLRFSGEANADLSYFLPAGDPAAGAYAGASSVRLDAVGGNRETSKFEASVVAGLVHAEEGTLPSAAVKKLYVSVYADGFDLSAGRMIVNYGRGTVFSPTDLFSAVDLGDLAWGRVGTDAVRALVPFGDFSGLDLVAAMAGKPEDATAGGRLYANVGGWDLGFSAFRDGGAFFGLDCKGDAVVGVSGEAAARIEASGARFRLMGGLDYSVGGEWFFDLEYLANVSAGDPEPRAEAFSAAHNLFLSLTWKPDEAAALDARAIASLSGSRLEWLSTLAAAFTVARGATATVYLQGRSGDAAGAALTAGARLTVAF